MSHIVRVLLLLISWFTTKFNQCGILVYFWGTFFVLIREIIHRTSLVFQYWSRPIFSEINHDKNKFYMFRVANYNNLICSMEIYCKIIQMTGLNIQCAKCLPWKMSILFIILSKASNEPVSKQNYQFYLFAVKIRPWPWWWVPYWWKYRIIEL